ncbi:DNA polymerase delta small subunit isoform X1 [Phoenix dactylifera]|uniref:DNA polymerase delta small subunit n=1 Tax=Phoenix dactylifera TaxID=42345 RepID=A0A8B8ZR45_PHODC|nr:DNA polymerase delta small subunit isoform X1 [Phoenix dactylifera]
MEDAEMGDGSPKHFDRKQAVYQNLDERYVIHGERYRGQQYSQIYFTRLHHMRNLLNSLVPKWKPHLPVHTILGLEEGKECIIIGTMYKHMKLKSSILDEYSKERSTVPLVKPHNFMHPDDHLILEDESGRVKLAGTFLAPSVYVTGIVVALHGKETSDGDFFVQDVLEAGLPPQIEQPLDLREDKHVVFISGLSVGSSMFNPLQFQLLVDHITGHLGDENEQSIASQIVRVVIAGNSVQISQGILSGQTLAPKDQSRLTEPIKEFDISLIQLAAAMPVDIMPGPSDPANFSLPQQPLHRCLFPGASVYNTFLSCTNPHQFELDDVLFLGTSGQNIDDLSKYSDAKDKLEFMERTLKWRHLAPTAPNTLGCYPYTDKDPFLIESCPHVYFVGNQDKYETRLLQGPEKQLLRLICIPRFCETGVAVVVLGLQLVALVAAGGDATSISGCCSYGGSSLQHWLLLVLQVPLAIGCQVLASGAARSSSCR